MGPAKATKSLILIAGILFLAKECYGFTLIKNMTCGQFMPEHAHQLANGLHIQNAEDLPEKAIKFDMPLLQTQIEYLTRILHQHEKHRWNVGAFEESPPMLLFLKLVEAQREVCSAYAADGFRCTFIAADAWDARRVNKTICWPSPAAKQPDTTFNACQAFLPENIYMAPPIRVRGHVGSIPPNAILLPIPQSEQDLKDLKFFVVADFTNFKESMLAEISADQEINFSLVTNAMARLAEQGCDKPSLRDTACVPIYLDLLQVYRRRKAKPFKVICYPTPVQKFKKGQIRDKLPSLL